MKINRVFAAKFGLFALLLGSIVDAESLAPVSPITTLPAPDNSLVEQWTKGFASRQEAAAALHQSALENLRRSGDVSKAREQFLKVLVLDPGHPGALFNLGVLAERDQRWNEAVNYFAGSIHANPESESAGVARNRLDRVQHILELSASAAGNKQMSYEIALARAEDAWRKGRSEEARLLLEPHTAGNQHWEAAAMMALLLAGEGRTNDALGYLRTARRNAPPVAMAQFDRAIDALAAPEDVLQPTSTDEARHLADNLRTSRELLAERGNERIREASALLLAQDVTAAVRVLAEALNSPAEAATAQNMLRELAPVSAAAEQALATAPKLDSSPLAAAPRPNLESLLPELVTHQMRLLASDTPKLMEGFATTARAQIPAQPTQTASVTPAPLAPVPEASCTVAPQTHAARNLNERGVYVQVGAFFAKAGADAVLEVLKTKGYDAVTANDGRTTAVLVGPIPDSAKVLEAQRHLAVDGFKGSFLRSRAGG